MHHKKSTARAMWSSFDFIYGNRLHFRSFNNSIFSKWNCWKKYLIFYEIFFFYKILFIDWLIQLLVRSQHDNMELNLLCVLRIYRCVLCLTVWRFNATCVYNDDFNNEMRVMTGLIKRIFFFKEKIHFYPQFGCLFVFVSFLYMIIQIKVPILHRQVFNFKIQLYYSVLIFSL